MLALIGHAIQFLVFHALVRVVDRVSRLPRSGVQSEPPCAQEEPRCYLQGVPELPARRNGLGRTRVFHCTDHTPGGVSHVTSRAGLARAVDAASEHSSYNDTRDKTCLARRPICGQAGDIEGVRNDTKKEDK